MGEDLRLSVHCQALAPFLDDVRSHRFGLVLVGVADNGLVSQAEALLVPGGLLIGVEDVPPPDSDA